jgi:hypothetical protein
VKRALRVRAVGVFVCLRLFAFLFFQNFSKKSMTEAKLKARGKSQ